jgi:hypothetical protein
LSGYCEPAPLTVDEDVREPNFSASFSLGIHNSVQSANIAELPIDVRMQFAQLIASRPAVDYFRQAFSAVVQLPIRIDILEFLGQNADNCVRIVPLKRLRPGLLKLNQGALVFSLSGWAIGAEGKRANQKREP